MYVHISSARGRGSPAAMGVAGAPWPALAPAQARNPLAPFGQCREQIPAHRGRHSVETRVGLSV